MKRRDKVSADVRRRQRIAREAMRKFIQTWPSLPVEASSLSPGSAIVRRLEDTGIQCGDMQPLKSEPDFFPVRLTRPGIKLSRLKVNGAYALVNIKDSTGVIVTVGYLQETNGTRTWSVIKP